MIELEETRAFSMSSNDGDGLAISVFWIDGIEEVVSPSECQEDRWDLGECMSVLPLKGDQHKDRSGEEM